MKKFISNYKGSLILILSVIIGSVIGIIFKEDAIILKPFGTIFLNLMFTVVVPLVFFTISSSIANMINLRRLGKILKYMFLVFIGTGLISSIIFLIGVKVYDPVGNASVVLEIGSEASKINLGDKIVEMLTVSDFANLLSRNNMLPLILFSILFGIAISLIGKEGNNLSKSLEVLSKVMLKFVKLIMYYAPIGLCAYFAALIGEYGKELLGSYARSIILYLVIGIIYYFVFYFIYSYIAGGKKGVKRFFKYALAPTLTSLATQSSLATLPSNLVATERIGVSKDIRDVTLPIGTTMHMEGSSMSSILKIAFLFGIFGKSFTGMDTYLIAILVSVLSGVVMSGIPGGGFIGEMLIVSLYGFPLSAFPIISTIGILIDAPATCLNVIGDTSGSMLIARCVDGKNWLK